MTALRAVEPRCRPPRRAPGDGGPTGLLWLLATELGASAVGFGVIVRWARRLEPSAFADVEYASAVSAWLLVLVRGGIEVIAYREAARRPRLVGPLTEVLIGLRCACALVGYALVAALAALVGGERGGVVMVAGLVLLPSAFVADVGPRARARLGWLALAQGLRTIGYAAAGIGLVSGPGHALRAAACGVAAEAVGALVPFALHVRAHGVPRPRFRRRAWVVLAYRGSIASLIRFGRVSLYGADLLALGWCAGADLGPYAAARRIVFALAALGLVVPGAVGPAIARGWVAGPSRARAAIREAMDLLGGLALPAAVGLAITSGQTMPLLFGPSYQVGAPWLALVAARLPWLLFATLAQSALVACRRESDALRLVLGMGILTALLIPASALAAGPRGVACASLAIEAAGAVGGWLLLRRLGVAPARSRLDAGVLVGCLVMGAVCLLVGSRDVWAVCLAGAAAYGATWELWRRATGPRSSIPGGIDP